MYFFLLFLFVIYFEKNTILQYMHVHESDL